MSNVNNSKKYTRPYKSLVILVTQEGGADPVLVSELENTIGEYTVVRNATGDYTVNFVDLVLTPNKSTIEIAYNDLGTAPAVWVSAYINDPGKAKFLTGNLYCDPIGLVISPQLSDTIMFVPYKIEVRVYN